MPVRVVCSQCHKQLQVPDQLLGKSVRCLACGAVFVAEEIIDAVLVEEPVPVVPPVAAPKKPGPPPLPAPGPSAVPRRRSFPPVEFKAIVKDDPDRVLKGQFQARVTEEGLRLRQGRKSGSTLTNIPMTGSLGVVRQKTEMPGERA